MTLRFIASINWSKATFWKFFRTLPFNRTETSCHGLQLASSTRCGTLIDTEFDPCPLDTPRYINMHISQYVRLPHILWIIMSVHCTLMVRSFSTFLHKFYSSLIFKNHLFIYILFCIFLFYIDVSWLLQWLLFILFYFLTLYTKYQGKFFHNNSKK